MDKGQVWVETVIYTLIGLGLISVVLVLVTPKINEYKDRSILEQTISSLNGIDREIQNVLSGGPGNARVVQFSMKRGKIFFDRKNNSILFVLDDSSVLFSESGQETSIGNIKVLSEKGTKKNKVLLRLDYNFDLDFEGDKDVLEFVQSSTPYKFRFENAGFLNSTQVVLFKGV